MIITFFFTVAKTVWTFILGTLQSIFPTVFSDLTSYFDSLLTSNSATRFAVGVVDTFFGTTFLLSSMTVFVSLLLTAGLIKFLKGIFSK